MGHSIAIGTKGTTAGRWQGGSGYLELREAPDSKTQCRRHKSSKWTSCQVVVNWSSTRLSRNMISVACLTATQVSVDEHPLDASSTKWAAS
jgi:hypothetical protein